MKLEQKTIIYIAGAGRSGSTLLDILIGNVFHANSLGEVLFFAENGIQDNEYCACGKTVTQCSFWSRVSSEWKSRRSLSLEQFILLQKEYTRNKNLIRNRFISKRDEQMVNYLSDLKLLYEIIFRHADHEVVIDSSKNTQYLGLLRQVYPNIHVIHLKRSFQGILSSAKKSIPKDSKAGVERDIVPRGTLKTLTTWKLDNIMTRWFSRGLPLSKIRYEQFVQNPAILLEKLSEFPVANPDLVISKGPLNPGHLVAGNKLRMSKDIYIKTKVNSNDRSGLTPANRLFARLVDLFHL